MLYMVDPAVRANVRAKEKNCKWNALKMEGNRRKMHVVLNHGAQWPLGSRYFKMTGTHNVRYTNLYYV